MSDEPATYAVMITSSEGEKQTYPCAGVQDQDALIYAGKVVETYADRNDLDASVTIIKNGTPFGPASTVRDMTTKSV